MRQWVVVLACVVGCKDKPAQVPASAPVVRDAAVAVDAAVATLQLTAEGPTELALAFDKRIPQLPAISSDGAQIATFDTNEEGMPPPVVPWLLLIERLDGGPDETLPLVDDTPDGDETWDTKPPDAATLAKLRERASVVTRRLAGFATLVPVTLPHDTTEKPSETKLGIGDITLTSVETTEGLVLTLTRSGRVVRRATRAAYNTDEKPDSFMGEPCGYTPAVRDAYLDAAKRTLYVGVVDRHNEVCTRQPAHWIVWPLAGEDPDPSAPLAKDAVRIERGTVTPATTKPETGRDVVVTEAADRKSAWASLVTADGSRASYVLAATADGWRVIATTTSKPVANATANATAKAGTLAPPPAFTAEPGDASLRAAFAQLTTGGLAHPPRELVAFGSGPGERTTTGAILARGWNAGWKGKTTVTSSIARLAPSGTTGWVAANVELAKPGYKIPFEVFAVFDKTADGWTLVHIHFSV